MKKLISLFFACFLLFSCSTTKKNKIDTNIEILPDFSPAIFMEGNATVNANFPNFNQTFSINLLIAGTDSLRMTAFGPFNLIAGRLYSDSDEFIFVNTLEMTAYIGRPSADNIGRASGMNLSFKDLASMIQGIPSSSTDSYKFVKKVRDESELLFQFENEDYVEFVTFDPIEKVISQFQRKDKNDNLRLNVFLSNYSNEGNHKIPKNIKFEVYEPKGKLIIEFKDIIVNKERNELKFMIPKELRVVNLP